MKCGVSVRNLTIKMSDYHFFQLLCFSLHFFGLSIVFDFQEHNIYNKELSSSLCSHTIYLTGSIVNYVIHFYGIMKIVYGCETMQGSLSHCRCLILSSQTNRKRSCADKCLRCLQYIKKKTMISECQS